MVVRDATVGPLSGTRAVSARATSTASTGRPSTSATICAWTVRAPWPISVLAVRMRTPRRVSSSEAFDASFTSPAPVNPHPWKKRDRPMPRPVPASAVRRSRKPVRATASSSTRRALQSGPITWPVAVRSPGRSALTRRTRTGSRPAASAIRSMWISAASSVCGAPNPRKAPFGGVLVIATRPDTRTWGHL